MMTVLTPSSGLNIGLHQKSEPMEDRFSEILKETKPRPVERKGKRPNKQEDGPNVQGQSPPKGPSKKTHKELDKMRSTKKPAAPSQAPPAPKQGPLPAPKLAAAPALTQGPLPAPKHAPAPKRAAQPISTAGPRQTDAAAAVAAPAAKPAGKPAASAHRGSNKDVSLRKQASAPSALPAPQRPGEVHQQRGSPPKAAAAITDARTMPTGHPTAGSAASSFPPPPMPQGHLLSKWAGPGFSLPPTPEALPMPSATLLASKKKGSL